MNPEGVQKIEAIEKVSLTQKETEVHSGRAIYNTRDNIIQILDKPIWKSGLREGSSDTLLLNRSNNTFFAEGNVLYEVALYQLYRHECLVHCSTSHQSVP